MTWTYQLLKTYDNLIGKPGVNMTPVAHMHAHAQIQVALSPEGEFLSASVIPREESVVLIPVSEASAGRTTGASPHAMHDTLSYVAQDFHRYCQTEKQRTFAQKKHSRYIENLEQWNNSEFSHPNVSAVYRYIKKNSLISDLIGSEIIRLDEDGLFSSEKISGQTYEKSLVFFSVADASGEISMNTDSSVVDCYIRYYSSLQCGKKDLCYITGEVASITTNYPKGIVSSPYNAKMISANDSSGFVFRGRFQNAEQALSVSYEASQKIHSALTWLVKNYGVTIGTSSPRTFICWNPDGKKLPDLLRPFEKAEEYEQNDYEEYRKRLSRMLRGYQEQFSPEDQAVIMAVDAATTGRLSVTYYSEMSASELLERIASWGISCSWDFIHFTDDRKPFYSIETPVLRRIASCAYGTERNGYIDADERVLKQQTERLLKCMIEGQQIPYNIITSLVNRVSVPLAYKRSNRERILSVACALIWKYYSDRGYINKGEKEKMILDKNETDRSYLFGRLLAVYEKIERHTYSSAETREPNAVRLQSAYVNHPFRIMMSLENAMIPYLQKMKPGSRAFYKNLIGEIISQFSDMTEQQMNQRLSEYYLIGYYLQRAELNRKIEKKEKTEEE